MPGLWWFELRNVFIVNERRGRIDQATTRRALGLLASLPVQLDHAANETVLLALARWHRLTVYDAAYLELARREGLPLATLDDMLARAAQAEKSSTERQRGIVRPSLHGRTGSWTPWASEQSLGSWFRGLGALAKAETRPPAGSVEVNGPYALN